MINNPLINPRIGSLSNSQGGIGVMQIFVSNFITLALGVAGMILLAMLIWGGYKYMTAGGDKEATAQGMSRIRNALIGIVLVFSIFAILFAIELLFGINLRQIKIPTVNTP